MWPDNTALDLNGYIIFPADFGGTDDLGGNFSHRKDYWRVTGSR